MVCTMLVVPSTSIFVNRFVEQIYPGPVCKVLFSCYTILYSFMLHFHGAGSSNEVSCFHRFTCSIRSNSHCSTLMFTRYGLAISARPLDGQFLTSISGHQMPSPCQRIPSQPAIARPFLDRHFRTPTCTALTKEASQPFVR